MTANASKSTKVPIMHKDLSYSDWKKELEVWEQTNIIRGVDKRVLAGELFESLQGSARSTVLSELTLIQIVSDTGVKQISDKLDEFFAGDKTQNKFSANDQFYKFKRDPSMSLEEFFIEFKLRQSKLAAAGSVLDDGVLGYTMLECANLPPEKNQLVRMTCPELSFKKNSFFILH